ncbi:hypothetical protein ABZV91_28000 [Nocardia sp. NPDC004568]|uniref:hypothetical protein n=1 Tax=Nocardia sp. NPDC004568 TaxID=3154551 RepID=UPI0033AF8071
MITRTVDGLAVLDIVPTADAFAAVDRGFALDYWVWSFLAAPYPVPEQLIAGNPEAPTDVLQHLMPFLRSASAPGRQRGQDYLGNGSAHHQRRRCGCGGMTVRWMS